MTNEKFAFTFVSNSVELLLNHEINCNFAKSQYSRRGSKMPSHINVKVICVVFSNKRFVHHEFIPRAESTGIYTQEVAHAIQKP